MKKPVPDDSSITSAEACLQQPFFLCKSQAASLLCRGPTSMEACVAREASLGLYTKENKKEKKEQNWEVKPNRSIQTGAGL